MGVIYNESLTSLDGLDNINPGTIYNLQIHNNPLLSECAVESICDYLLSPAGTVEIHDNTVGCNSLEEVEEACETISIWELRAEDNFTITPNPVESITLIQYTLHHNSPVTLKFMDLNGQEIAILVNEIQQQGKQNVVFNSKGLKPGVYFCVLETNDTIQSVKMIKL